MCCNHYDKIAVVVEPIMGGSFLTFTDDTCGAGTVNPSEALEFTTDFKWSSCYSIFSFMCNVL